MDTIYDHSRIALDGRKMELLLRNISGMVVLVTVVYGMGHVITRLAEQHTLLSNERQHDYEVLRMCSEQRLASDSARMRSMCLQARADTSTPVILAAILKTCRLVTMDLCESMPSVYSPYSLMVVCTVLPWVLPLIRMLSPPTRIVVDDSRGEGTHHVTFVVPTDMAGMTSAWNGWNAWKNPKSPAMLCLDDCETAHLKYD